MTATEASLKALAAHTQKRRESVDTRACKALRSLRREEADITLSSVARRAGVTQKHPQMARTAGPDRSAQNVERGPHRTSTATGRRRIKVG